MNRYKTKPVIIFAIVAAFLLIFASIIYFKLYYINMNQMDLCIGQGSFESPEGNYIVSMGVYPVGDVPPTLDNREILPYIAQNNVDAYIIGYLKWSPNVQSDGSKVWSGENSKIIFFDQYDKSDISVAWENESTVMINGVALKVPNQVFDYRRSRLKIL